MSKTAGLKTDGQSKDDLTAGGWQYLVASKFLLEVSMMTLTKADIAQKIANDCGFMTNEAAEVLGKLLDVMISGFGKWTVKSKDARRGRNPQTGESIRVTN